MSTSKTFIVRFKARELTPQAFTAERVEFHGEHLVLRTSSGKLAALFLAELVESWAEVNKVCVSGQCSRSKVERNCMAIMPTSGS
jgi:hypothetical protein